MDFGHAAVMHPDPGCLYYREEVDCLEVASDGVVQQVPVGSHPELDGVWVGEGRQVLDGHDAAEGAGPGVKSVVGPGDPAADGGAYPVGADNKVGAMGPPVGELQHDLLPLVDDVD